MNLSSLFRIAKTLAPVVLSLVTVAAPLVKAALAKERARPKG
jgi:hypothetical protein